MVAVGESPQQVTQEVAEKFSSAAHVIIKRKELPVESLKYIFSVIPELKCKNYTLDRNKISVEVKKN